jgi:sterol desaturase/sphingolipid hydroxylase (fatty acid hydroxylase superfamily)
MSNESTAKFNRNECQGLLIYFIPYTKEPQQARAGLYVWKDTVAVVFHFLSLAQLLVCWLIGKLPLGLLLFMPSLLLRIRNYFKFSRDKEFRSLVATSLCAYITYTAFIVEFLKSYFTHVFDKKSPHK